MDKTKSLVTNKYLLIILATVFLFTISFLVTLFLSQLPLYNSLIYRLRTIHYTGHNLTTYWYYYLAYLGLFFVPGYSFVHFLSKLKKATLTPEVILVLSPFASILIMFLQGLLFLWSKNELFLQLQIVFFVFAIFYFFYHKLFLVLLPLSNYLFLIILSLVTINITTYRRDQFYGLETTGYRLDTALPIPVTGYTGYDADSLTPWRIGRFYYQQSNETQGDSNQLVGIRIHERTPLLPIIITTNIGLFGQSHFAYARFLEILALFYYLGIIFLISSRGLGPSQRNLIFILLLCNVQLSLMSYNTELFYKYFASYPLIIATSFALNNKKTNPLFSISLLALVSFLIHPYTIIISLVLAIVHLVSQGFSLKSCLISLYAFSPLLLFFIYWYSSSGAMVASSSQTSSVSVYSHQVSQEPKPPLLATKSLNLLQLIYPNPLQSTVNPIAKITPTESKFQFYRYSLIANLSPTLFVVLTFLIFLKPTKNNPALMVFGLGPLLVFWLIYLNSYNQLFNYGGTYFLLYHFSIPLLLLYTLESLKSKSTTFIVTCSYLLWMATVYREIGDPFTSPTLVGSSLNSVTLVQFFVFLTLYILAAVYSLISVK